MSAKRFFLLTLALLIGFGLRTVVDAEPDKETERDRIRERENQAARAILAAYGVDLRFDQLITFEVGNPLIIDAPIKRYTTSDVKCEIMTTVRPKDDLIVCGIKSPGITDLTVWTDDNRRETYLIVAVPQRKEKDNDRINLMPRTSCWFHSTSKWSVSSISTKDETVAKARVFGTREYCIIGASPGETEVSVELKSPTRTKTEVHSVRVRNPR